MDYEIATTELFKKEIEEGTLIVSTDSTYSSYKPVNTLYFLLTAPDGFYLKGRVILDTGPDSADQLLTAIKDSFAQTLAEFREEHGITIH